MTQAGDKTVEGRPKRTRIELLVREADGDGFETQQISSAVAYLHSRPQRIPDADWEMARLPYAPQGVVTYALKNRRTEQIIQITETEKFLWGQMDGRASLQEIATAYLLNYGSFDFEIIPTLIVKLLRADLLTMRPVSRLRAVLARNRRNPAARAMEGTLHALERLTVTSRRSHQFFERMYRYGGFLLFTPWAVAALVLMVALGIHSGIKIWHNLSEVTRGLASHPIVAILLVKLVDSTSARNWTAGRRHLQHNKRQRRILMVLDYRVYERRDRLRRSALRHSFDRGATNPPTLVTQRIEQRHRVERLIVADSLSRIQPRRLVTFSQTRRQLALMFESLCDVFDSDDESRNRLIVVTQRRDRDALLHLVEIFGRSNGSTGDQVMMKGRCEHLHYAFVE